MNNELMHKVLGIVGISLLAACSSSSSGNAGGGTGQTTPVQQTEFPAQYVSAICDNVAPCCQSAGFAYDANGCRATQMSRVGDLTKAGSLEGVTWDANAAGTCIALTKQIAASCTVTMEQITQYEAVCTGVLVGSKPIGAACTNSAQCAAPAGGGTAFCPSGDVATGGGVPGTGGGTSGGVPPQATCQVQTAPTASAHAKQGEPCNTTCTDSTDGSGSCSGQATSGGGGGAAPTPAASGTCYTNDGLTCDFATSKCAPLAPVGQPCVSGEGCVADAYCKSNACVPKPKAGEACSITEYAPCADGLFCDTGAMKCSAQLPPGSACTSASANPCANGHCSGNKCVANGQVASSDLCTGASSSNPQPGTPTSGGGTSSGGTAGASGAGGAGG